VPTAHRVLVTCSWMHIEKLLLRDVGPFDDAAIEFPKGTDPQLADVYLLTGPNGTGKSTILYALASLVGADRVFGRKVDLSSELFTKRMRSRSKLVAVRTDDGQTYAVTFPEYTSGLESNGSVPDPRTGYEASARCGVTMRWTIWSTAGLTAT
jgi:energy-coupling factor transporter ATP-binding protein EcfA2